jgi:hypothetical protein
VIVMTSIESLTLEVADPTAAERFYNAALCRALHRPGRVRVGNRAARRTIVRVTSVTEVLEASGAEVVQEQGEQPYGVRDCAFRDPAGRIIRHDGSGPRARRQSLAAITTVAVAGALFGLGAQAFHDMYKFPFGHRPGGTVRLGLGPGAKVSRPGSG